MDSRREVGSSCILESCGIDLVVYQNCMEDGYILSIKSV